MLKKQLDRKYRAYLIREMFCCGFDDVIDKQIDNQILWEYKYLLGQQNKTETDLGVLE